MSGMLKWGSRFESGGQHGIALLGKPAVAHGLGVGLMMLVIGWGFGDKRRNEALAYLG